MTTGELYSILQNPKVGVGGWKELEGRGGGGFDQNTLCVCMKKLMGKNSRVSLTPYFGGTFFSVHLFN